MNEQPSRFFSLPPRHERSNSKESDSQVCVHFLKGALSLLKEVVHDALAKLALVLVVVHLEYLLERGGVDVISAFWKRAGRLLGLLERVVSDARRRLGMSARLTGSSLVASFLVAMLHNVVGDKVDAPLMSPKPLELFVAYAPVATAYRAVERACKADVVSVQNNGLMVYLGETEDLQTTDSIQ